MMKPVIGITVGDYNGIGPEVGLKAAMSPQVRRICRPVLIGPLDIFEWYARRCRLNIVMRELGASSERTAAGVLDVVTLWQYHSFRVAPGRETHEAGSVAGEAITVAAHLALEGEIDAIVT